MITFHDPRGEIGHQADPYELSYDLTSAGEEPPKVALLANGFPDSENFLSAVGRALEQKFPGIEIKLWNKGNASIAAPQEMLDEITGHAQVAIAAYGH